MFTTRFKYLKNYILHFLTARNTGGYGVHSPYLFHFTRFILKNNHRFYAFDEIEKTRLALKNDKRLVLIDDFGTGDNRTEKISTIASNSLQSPKFAQLFFRIINHYKMRNVLELGTSLGITTSYLAASSNDINCVTLEGSPQIANIASANFQQLKLENINPIVGNIDDTLEKTLNKIQTLDFVYFDANHTYEAVIAYFKMCLPYINSKTIFVFDDIYWSAGMKNAWEDIKSNSSVSSTIDLFQVGLVFFNPDLHKKHYKMRF